MLNYFKNNQCNMILIMEGKERQKGRENKGTNERKKGEQLKEIKGWPL